MKAVIAERLGQPWVTADISDPQPGARDLLVQVEASSVCHTDIRLATDARFGGTFPRVPGHEFVGRVVERGWDVQQWEVGDRVGVAWAQRWCGKCRHCLEQSYSFCERGNDVSGGTVDGGHAEYAVVDSFAAVPLPVEPPADQLAPLMCAGYTAYSALRQARVHPGDRVAVLGIGGVGHLAIQYARGLGATVVAVTRDPSKEAELHELGAAEVLSADGGALGAELSRMGGVDVAVITADGRLEAIFDGLRIGARVALVAVGDQSLQLQMRSAVFKRLTVIGSSPGSRRLLQELLAFHFTVGAHSKVERLPLDAATEAFARVRDGQARYRIVFIPQL